MKCIQQVQECIGGLDSGEQASGYTLPAELVESASRQTPRLRDGGCRLYDDI